MIIAYSVADAVTEPFEAGMVVINQSIGDGENTPRVGAKQRGSANRGSVEGHSQFSQVRVLSK